MKSSSPLHLESINHSVVAQDVKEDWITQDDDKKPSPTHAKKTQKDNTKKRKRGRRTGLRSGKEKSKDNKHGGKKRNCKTSDNKKTESDNNNDSVAVVDAFKAAFLKPPPEDICLSCGMNPCEKELYSEVITKAGMAVVKMKDHNKAICHHLYKYYIAANYGLLGKTNQIRIPFCIESYIRLLYPNPNGEYTGFSSSYGDNNPCEQMKNRHTDPSFLAPTSVGVPDLICAINTIHKNVVCNYGCRFMEIFARMIGGVSNPS